MSPRGHRANGGKVKEESHGLGWEGDEGKGEPLSLRGAVEVIPGGLGGHEG